MAQGLGAACQDEIRDALFDIAETHIDRLHPRTTVALHRPAGHGFIEPEAQRRDAAGIDLVGNRVDAAEDHLVERIRTERLAQKQRPAAGDGEIDRGKRSGLAARLQERRARAVDYIDRTACRLTGVGCDGFSSFFSRQGLSSAGAKSSTMIASCTASLAACNAAVSAAVSKPPACAACQSLIFA